MVLFIILGAVVLAAMGVLVVLFFMLSKEQKVIDEKVVPATNLFQPVKPKPLKEEVAVVMPFQPKVSLPVNEVQKPIEDAYKKRAQELENELRTISQKADTQSDEAKKMIAALAAENEELKNQKAALEEAKQQLAKLQLDSSSLKSENTQLQAQLDAADAKVHFLEEEMTAVKVQMGDELSHAKAAVTQITQEKDELAARLTQPPQEPLRQELESLNAEQAELKKKYVELEGMCRNLREMNTHLVQKNEALQYEMVKSRAQTSGLERMSFNYQHQVEDFLRKIAAFESSQVKLSEDKNRLEGLIDEIKTQNEELAKKDQLAQFELEKNRSRVANLEKECQDLKMQIGKDNP